MWSTFIRKIRFDLTRANTIMATHNTSLSSHNPPSNPKSVQATQSKAPRHASDVDDLKNLPQTSIGTVSPLSIPVSDDPPALVTGFLHIPQNFNSKTDSKTGSAAAILLSGASGGVVGPSSIYLSIADKLSSLSRGIPVLRLDYRYPVRNKYCVRDVHAAMTHLFEHHGIQRFMLVGWSFGGAPVFTIAADDERVVGCATVASQTAGTDGVRKLAPRPLLLLHGLADKRQSPVCAERLYSIYEKTGDRKMQLFERDDHSLSKNALAAEEMLCNFIIRCIGIDVSENVLENVATKEIVPSGERLKNMEIGGDIEEDLKHS